MVSFFIFVDLFASVVNAYWVRQAVLEYNIGQTMVHSFMCGIWFMSAFSTALVKTFYDD